MNNGVHLKKWCCTLTELYNTKKLHSYTCFYLQNHVWIKNLLLEIFEIAYQDISNILQRLLGELGGTSRIPRCE